MPIHRLPRSAAARGARRAIPRAAAVLLLLPVLFLSGCDEDFADPSAPPVGTEQVLLLSGNGQFAFVGEAVPQPLRVQVRDERGRPLARQRVEFRILSGDGALTSAEAVTDFAGIAQVGFTPFTEGDLVIEVVHPGGGDAARTTFTVRSLDRSRLEDPAAFEKVAGDGQTGQVGTILPLPLTVRLANEFGDPLVDFPVLFTATTDGTLLLTANEGDFTRPDSLDFVAPSDSIGRQIVSFTDENGIAAALLRLRDRPGGNEVTASTTFVPGSNNAVTFTATGTAGSAASADSVAKVAGDEQNVTVDTTGVGFTPSITFNPMVVQVTDRFGNPIPGITVFFRVSVGFGTLSNATAVTDANGFAETVYTSNAGSLGDVAVSAAVPGVGAVTFTGEIIAEGGTEEEEDGDTGDGGTDGGSNPTPTLSGISPSSATAGTPGPLTMNVNGSGFVSSSSVLFDGVPRTTTFVSESQLQITLTDSDLATAGSFDVLVFNPTPGGGTSSPATFTVNP